MNLSTQSIALRIVAVFFVVALASNAITSFRTVKTLRESLEPLQISYDVHRTIDGVLSTMQDAETGQRGYIITGERVYLEPYANAVSHIDSLVARIHELTERNPSQAAHFPALDWLVNAKLGELQATLETRTDFGFEAALAALASEQGRFLMDSLRTEVAEMQAEANRDLLDRKAVAASAGRRATWSLVFSNAALLSLLVLLGSFVSRNLALRQKARVELEESNVALSAALSERQDALTRVQAMQSQLIQQEKLAGLGRVIAGVAHELKNPLNFVNNFAELSSELVVDLEEAFSSGDQEEVNILMPILKQNVDKIHLHGVRADEIVRSMLTHARGVSGDRNAVNLHALIDLAVDQALEDPTNNVDITIEKEYDASLDGKQINAVESALNRVFLNLVKNAYDAVTERELGDEAGYEPRIRLTTKRETDDLGAYHAVVVVADNGIGIPEEKRERVFEPFYTTKAPGDGTGLGLSMAFDIAEGHGGTIVASTGEDGQGTSFTVTLPLDQSAQPVPEESTADAE